MNLLAVPLIFLVATGGPESAPNPPDNIKQMGEKCRARDLKGIAPPNWQETYCSCMEREVPRRMSSDEYLSLISPAAAATATAHGQKVDDSKLREAMAECIGEAGRIPGNP